MLTFLASTFDVVCIGDDFWPSTGAGGLTELGLVGAAHSERTPTAIFGYRCKAIFVT